MPSTCTRMSTPSPSCTSPGSLRSPWPTTSMVGSRNYAPPSRNSTSIYWEMSKGCLGKFRIDWLLMVGTLNTSRDIFRILMCVRWKGSPLLGLYSWSRRLSGTNLRTKPVYKLWIKLSIRPIKHIMWPIRNQSWITFSRIRRKDREQGSVLCLAQLWSGVIESQSGIPPMKS